MIDISDCLEEIKVGEQIIHLDLVACVKAMNAISQQNKQASNYEHLEGFMAYVETACGMKLRIAQADRLWEEINLKVSREKKEYLEALTSLNSTDSTPSA